MAIHLAVFALLTLGWYALGKISTPKGSSAKPKPVTTSALLEHVREQYVSYNEMWFDGKLPKDTIFTLTPNTSFQAETDKVNGTFVIRFNPKYNLVVSQIDLNLLHESCHIVTWDEDLDHGVRWVGCMRSLAARGALDRLW